MVVFEAYAKGDKVAKKIIENNTDRIAYVINKAYEKNTDCKTLALAGSLYKNEYFLESVKKKLNPELKCVISENPPVYGACVLCCKMLGMARSSIFLRIPEDKSGGFFFVLIFLISITNANSDNTDDNPCAIKVAHATPATPQLKIAVKI